MRTKEMNAHCQTLGKSISKPPLFRFVTQGLQHSPLCSSPVKSLPADDLVRTSTASWSELNMVDS
jgi:hypothetical protein